MSNVYKLPNEGEEAKHRLRINENGYLCLCDEDGNEIPRQINLSVESSIENPRRLIVTMQCYIYPYEIEEDLLKEFTYIVQSKEVDG